MKTVPNDSINISKNSNGGFIQNHLIDCVKDIIFQLRMNFDIEYKDNTYKELYIKTINFAKEIDEILSSEIIKQDNLFNSTPDFYSFKNDKLV